MVDPVTVHNLATIFKCTPAGRASKIPGHLGDELKREKEDLIKAPA